MNLTIYVSRKVTEVDSKVSTRQGKRTCSQTTEQKTVIEEHEVPVLFLAGCWLVHQNLFWDGERTGERHNSLRRYTVSHSNGMAAGWSDSLKEAKRMCQNLGLVAPAVEAEPKCGFSRDVAHILGPIAGRTLAGRRQSPHATTNHGCCLWRCA